MRRAEVKRKTRETAITLKLDLDGKGKTKIDTGIGFFDHMLDLLARHAGITLVIKARGDLHVDDHHLVEDVGIGIGRAISEALGAKLGIARYGWAVVPMDESLVMCAIDLGGRSHLAYGLEPWAKRIRGFETELIEEFFTSLASNGKMSIHLHRFAGKNSHHVIEAGFKAFARALRQAIKITEPERGVPSTKGVL